MLTIIRDKLKSWVIIFLVILVAIPLVFLGVGDYGSNQEQYAFKVDDIEVNKPIVLQEMRQFKEVLRKNYQGTIPPIYTDSFIKKVTIDNLVRRNIENRISTNLGLVLSDQSIINEIKNTSSFRDENGFNPKLYKKRLFMINMNPEVYEQYIYQKGIRDQLRKSVTDTAILSVYDKKININSQYHKKNGKILILQEEDVKKEISVSLDEINNYYEENKNSFMTNEKAKFAYIRLNKNEFIKSVEVTKTELLDAYNRNLKSNKYKLDDLYEINHLVFPISSDRESVISEAEKSYNDLISGKSFSTITENYNVSDDTKKNKGYLGNVSLGNLPDIVKSNIIKMKPSDVQLIKTESNAIHILKLKNITKGGHKKYKEVMNELRNQLSNTKGSKEYFATLDKVKEQIYTNKISLSELSKNYELSYIETSKIDKFDSDEILSLEVLSKLFSNLDNQGVYSPIYISNDDIMFLEKTKYYEPEQLSMSASEAAIRALLMTQKTRNKLNNIANNILLELNNGVNNSYKKFSIYKYDKVFDDEITSMIVNQGITDKFISNKTSNGDYVFIKIDSILEDIDKDRIVNDNFLDYLENTQSESDYNSLYISKYKKFSIDINDDFLNQ